MFPTLVDIGCFSHTLDSCWRKIVHSDSNLVYGLVDQFVQPQPDDDAIYSGRRELVKPIKATLQRGGGPSLR